MFFKKRSEGIIRDDALSIRGEKNTTELAINPCDVAPADTNPFSLDRVIYDQGPNGFSLALGTWGENSEGKKTEGEKAGTGRRGQVIAIRWNGTPDEVDTGYPTYPGNGEQKVRAKWFPLPREFNPFVLEYIANHDLSYLLQKYELKDLCKRSGQ